MIATNNQLFFINIHCVNNSKNVRILTFPVLDTSCPLHVFMADAEETMRGHFNNIGAVEQARLRKDGYLKTYSNIYNVGLIPVGFLDSSISFGVIEYDLVIFFSSTLSILLDSDHNKELIGIMLLFNFIYVQYTYPIKLTYNLLTIYYIAVACLNKTKLGVDTACCSDIAFVNACNGRRMVCSVNLGDMTAEEVGLHYGGHTENNQTFLWKELPEVAPHLQPFVNSVLTIVKDVVGNIAFV